MRGKNVGKEVVIPYTSYIEGYGTYDPVTILDLQTQERGFKYTTIILKVIPP